MATQALLFVLAAGLVANAQDTNHVVNLPHNQPHFVVIDGRQPFQPGPLPQHLPLPVQQTLITLSQADIPNILTASPGVSHVLLPANPTIFNPIITPVSAPIVLENPVPAPIVLENASLFVPHTSVQTNSQIQTSSESASSTASLSTSNLAQVSSSPSEVSSTSSTIGHSASSVQPRTRTSPSGSNEGVPTPLSQHIANSESQNSASGTADSAASLALSSTSISAGASSSASSSSSSSSAAAAVAATAATAAAAATTAPSTSSPLLTTFLSNINVDATTVSSVNSEAAIATTGLTATSPQAASTTVSSIDVIEETSASPATDASLILLQTASILNNKIPSGDSSSPLKQQKLSPAPQFSARLGLTSESALSETQSTAHQEEIISTQSASSADQGALSDGSDATQSLRDRVMPSAEEVTARRLATIARQKTSSSTSAPTSTSSIATTTTISTTTITSSPQATGTTSAPVPSTSSVSQIVNTVNPVPVTTAPSHQNSIAKLFQSISRAAAQNVAKLAALSQSQRQGTGIEPVVAEVSEAAEQSEVVGNTQKA